MIYSIIIFSEDGSSENYYEDFRNESEAIKQFCGNSFYRKVDIYPENKIVRATKTARYIITALGMQYGFIDDKNSLEFAYEEINNNVLKFILDAVVSVTLEEFITIFKYLKVKINSDEKSEVIARCVLLGKREKLFYIINTTRISSFRGVSMSPLTASIITNDKDLFYEFLNRKNNDIDFSGSWKLTPLMAAVHGNNTEFVKELIKMNADVHKKDIYGDTAEGIAIKKGYDDLLHLLYEN